MIRILYSRCPFVATNRQATLDLAECIVQIWNNSLSGRSGNHKLHLKEYLIQRYTDIYFEFETEEDAVMFKLTYNVKCLD